MLRGPVVEQPVNVRRGRGPRRGDQDGGIGTRGGIVVQPDATGQSEGVDQWLHELPIFVGRDHQHWAAHNRDRA